MRFRILLTETTGSLVPQWVYHVPDARSLQTTPIVYAGVMYLTNSNRVYALDARAGPASTAATHRRSSARARWRATSRVIAHRYMMIE